MSRPPSAALKPARVWMPRSCSWPRSRTGNRQSVADIGQIIFEIAVFVVLRIEWHAGNLAVAGGEAPADRAHAAPFGTIDRQRIQEPDRGCEQLRPDPSARVRHGRVRRGKIL